MTTPTENTWMPFVLGTFYRDKTHAIEFCDSSTNRRWWDDDGLNSNGATHWRRVELPPLPAKTFTQEERDSLACQHWVATHHAGYSADYWHAALAHERAFLGAPAEQFLKELRECLDVECGPLDIARLTMKDKHRLRVLLDRAAKG